MSYLAKLKARLAEPAGAPALPFVGFDGDRCGHIPADQAPQGCLHPPVFFSEEERKLKNQFFSEKKPRTDAGQLDDKSREIRVGEEPPKPTKGSDDSQGDPDLWRAKLYNLSPFALPCPGFHDREWRRVFDAAHAFLEGYAETAHALGWTGFELFGVHPVVGATRVDCCGALMVSSGSKVVLVERNTISFERARFCRRVLTPDAVLVWEFGR